MRSGCHRHPPLPAKHASKDTIYMYLCMYTESFAKTFAKKTLENSTFNFPHILSLHTKGHRIVHSRQGPLVKSRYIGDGHPTNRNPYNGYINPYESRLMTIPYYMEMSWELIDPIAHIETVKCSNPQTSNIQKYTDHVGP